MLSCVEQIPNAKKKKWWEEGGRGGGGGLDFEYLTKREKHVHINLLRILR